MQHFRDSEGAGSLAHMKEKECWFYPVFALWLSTAALIELTWDCAPLDEVELLISMTLRLDGTTTYQNYPCH